MFFLPCILDKTDTDLKDLKEAIKEGDYSSNREGCADSGLDSARLRAGEQRGDNGAATSGLLLQLPPLGHS